MTLSFCFFLVNITSTASFFVSRHATWNWSVSLTCSSVKPLENGKQVFTETKIISGDENSLAGGGGVRIAFGADKNVKRYSHCYCCTNNTTKILLLIVLVPGMFSKWIRNISRETKGLVETRLRKLRTCVTPIERTTNRVFMTS